MSVDVSDDLPTVVVVPRPGTTPPPAWWARTAHALLWLAIALPALYQIGLLIQAIAGRIGYPYDLEWMEGGLLQHAQRIRHGDGIYVAPSIDFIPYLYTPLYPTLLAMFSGLFGGPFGPSYLLGRAISVIGLVGIAATAPASFASPQQHRLITASGVVLGLGLFAACYPFVEGWYDLVRADTFFLFMITAGIAGLAKWAASDSGAVGHGKVAAGAALLALAFFCKQTGIFYVAFGGAIVLCLSWRRVPTYIAMAGLVGLGGTWLLNLSTRGWFWTYVSEIHRAHDFNMDRFYASFRQILWHFPALTMVVVVTALVLAVTVRSGGVPAAARAFVVWAAAYVVSTVVGAISWGTEFAHFNAYMPALLHGSLAAGAAIPAMHACIRQRTRRHRRGERLARLCAAALALPLAITCFTQRWSPQRFMPTAADVAAGGRLIERLRSIDGDIWMPSHPWYPVLAGKAPHVHRMGIKDVTTRQDRQVAGLDDKLRNHGFAALVLDNRDLNLELPVLRQYYRPAFVLPVDERPRVRTGASVVPDAIWIPSIPATPPPSAKVVFDFEAARWTDGWTATGTAWGPGPVTEAMPGQPLVLGATGARFATSMTGGDAAIGRLSSPLFTLDGARLTLRIAGGVDPVRLRAELWVERSETGGGDPAGSAGGAGGKAPLGIDSTIVRLAGVPGPAGDSLRTVTIELGELRGKLARLLLVDDAHDGHLDVDDVWLWQAPGP